MSLSAHWHTHLFLTHIISRPIIHTTQCVASPSLLPLSVLFLACIWSPGLVALLWPLIYLRISLLGIYTTLFFNSVLFLMCIPSFLTIPGRQRRLA